MEPKLVSMKMSAADVKKRTGPEKTIAEGAPKYPWGLSLNLDDSALEKLGIDELPASEEQYYLCAMVEVTGSSSSDYAGGGKTRSVTLQIMSMALEDPDDMKDHAGKLYDKGGDD